MKIHVVHFAFSTAFPLWMLWLSMPTFLMKVLMSNLHQSALEWFYFIKMSHFENAKASYMKYAFFKTKINFAFFYQCI